MRASSPRHGGFTLIELLVSIAIMATLIGIAAPTIYENLTAGDIVKCRGNLENLAKIGAKYGQDMAHAHLLPTSGMGDDPDTAVDENEGWWVSLADADDDAVVPTAKGAKVKLNAAYRCPGDKRATVTGEKFKASTKTVSYVSWTDCSNDPGNPHAAIRTTAKQNLDALPWLSDGNPVKGKSVNSLASFKKMVMPAVNRHRNTLLVLYASGIVKAFEVDPEQDTPDKLFKRIAPTLRSAGPKVRKHSDEEEEEAADGEAPENAAQTAGDDAAEAESQPEPESELQGEE